MFNKAFSCSALIATACTLSLGAIQPAQAAVDFDWATIGNAGNAADGGSIGAVGYDYRIAKTEVTNAQYVEFLNAKAATDTYGLFNTEMTSGDALDNALGVDHSWGGITRSGASGSYTYAAKAGRGDNPVAFVSYFDSVRFINWLHNGQGSGDTETGAYTLLGGTATPSNSETLTRNAGASYFMPNRDEWYKAAYHDKSAGTAGDYFDYATGSDTLPAADSPANNLAAVNAANTLSAISNPDDSPYTDVGAYTGALSPYGTFDQTGNVDEWTETPFEIGNPVPPLRTILGGSWGSGINGPITNALLSTSWGGAPSDEETAFFGFRVGSEVSAGVIPEPGSLALLALAAPMILRRRRG